MQEIKSVEQLEALYGAPHPRSLDKEIDHIAAPYQTLIEASPFVVIASVGRDGVDCSPRGDPPGFVRVIDPKTVMIPDRRGNNRIDTLRNIVEDGRVHLLFMIPGVGETLRIDGQASLLIDPELLETFSLQGKTPRSVLSISVKSVYFQCQKAIARAKLWDSGSHIDRSTLPSAGDMLGHVTGGAVDAKDYDRQYPKRLLETIY